VSEAQTPKKRRWSWLWAALITSLALNLAVVAAVTTHRFGGHGGHGRISGPGLTQVLPRAFFRSLDRDRRAELVGVLGEHRKEFRSLRKELRENARGLAAALRAEPYDPAAVNTALQVYDNSATTMIVRGRTIAEDFFTRLTPEERLTMADEIERKTMSRQQWRRLNKEQGDRGD